VGTVPWEENIMTKEARTKLTNAHELLASDLGQDKELAT
jgi:hypothetical protein